MASNPGFNAKYPPAMTKKLLENLQSDLRMLSSDCKRKYPHVKDASEGGLLKIRGVMNKTEDVVSGLRAVSIDIVEPLIQGCSTKNQKVVVICLTAVQRLISHEALSETAAVNIIHALWVLMEAGIEELKLLQTAILLITTNDVVQHDALSKALVLCFRLHFTKDSTTINTAAATVRQLVSVVFDRVIAEDEVPPTETLCEMSVDVLKSGGPTAPKSLRPAGSDAYLLFQDFCQLVNADQPHWLVGMTEMTRTFGLELMEGLLSTYPSVFLQHPEFSFLLKERVCPLIIKLFSPSLKYRHGMPASSPSPMEKPYFPIVVRLLRIVSVLIKHYYLLLTTECEIFLSLLVKFLDPEKPSWQRATALEVLNKLCAKSHLIKSFCQSYDMKQHSTKIFRDIVNGLGSFIQSNFVSPLPHTSSMGKTPDTQGSPPALVSGMPVGGGITPQAAFMYRGIWIPLTVNIAARPGSHKPIFLEMLDRIEPPSIPDGYSMSIAFLCLLDVVGCVQLIIRGKDQLPQDTADVAQVTEEDWNPKEHADKALYEELINSSWCGVLAAFTLLLDASTDESATERILKSEQAYAHLCGALDMTLTRDAFITALCKASLPPNYALTVLNMYPQQGLPKGPQRQLSAEYPAHTAQEVIQGSQVVAVGTALPTTSFPSGAQQGPVMLTAKNIQCMRSILSVAHCHGVVLGNAWHLVLTTLQHLVWILGLKPSSGGSLKVTQQSSDTSNTVITTAVMADLPVLSSMLSRLFESSQLLDEVALHHLIDALCKLSNEAMELAYSNREPSLFAVAKLLETGLVNLPRVDVLWKPVTAHLLEVCQHPHSSLRAWGAEAVTSLIKAGLDYKYDPPLYKQVRLQSMILAPLQQLSTIMHADIRQRQLECLLQILHKSGDTLNHGWPLILNVIGAVTNDQSEGVIRLAFQSLQLVVTDFLPIMPCSCLQLCVEAAAKFGSQHQELNISLTAIGLLWSISDYFSQNSAIITTELCKDLTDSERSKQTIPPFDSLWMCVYSRLGGLCVDARPAVRKSAGQTLFTTIAAHGALLQSATWQTVLWQVLFLMLEKVKKLSSEASVTKESKKDGNILIHHSRDTAEKQWAETQVLSLAGVARVFNNKRRVLQSLGDFPRAWALLLDFIESQALCCSAEVSLAALKSFQEILRIKRNGIDSHTDEWKLIFGTKNPLVSDLSAPKEETINRATDGSNPTTPSLELASTTYSLEPDSSNLDDMSLWSNAWKVWLSIATTATMPPEGSNVYIPSQSFLTALMQIFPALYDHIKSRFVTSDLHKLSTVLHRALSVPVHSDASPFIMPVGEIGLTPLQEAILCSIEGLHKELISGQDANSSMAPDLFNQLLTFVEFSVKMPKFGKMDTKPVIAKGSQAEWVAMNYVPFAERVVEMIVQLYKSTCEQPAVIEQHVLFSIIKTFRLPLSLKYGCPSQTTWILVIRSLLTMLNTGLPVAHKHAPEFIEMWTELGHTLNEFLFSKHPPPPTLSVEDFQRDEAIDCKVVKLIRDDILPHAKKLPSGFVVTTMNILNKGSIHSATTSSAFIDTDSSRKLREEFAKCCFETLLQFSFITRHMATDEGSISKLAVTALLQRCQDVLTAYVTDERLSGKCPLPRPRMAEMSFVLKAVSTLLVTLKKAPPSNIEPSIWAQVIELYPHLVECSSSTSHQVCKALREALHEYADLLAPPSEQNSNHSNIPVQNGV